MTAQQRYYQRCIAAGLCTACGKQKAIRFRRCEACRRLKNTAQQKRSWYKPSSNRSKGKPHMYQVIWMYDGVPGQAATIALASKDECVKAVRAIRKKRASLFSSSPKTDLAIVDLTIGRLVSYTL